MTSLNKSIIVKWRSVDFFFQIYEFALYEIYILIIIHWALLEIYKNPLIYSQIESFPTHLLWILYIYIYISLLSIVNEDEEWNDLRWLQVCWWLTRPMRYKQVRLHRLQLKVWSGFNDVLLRFFPLHLLFLWVVLQMFSKEETVWLMMKYQSSRFTPMMVDVTKRQANFKQSLNCLFGD